MLAKACVGAGDDTGLTGERDGGWSDGSRGNEKLAVQETTVGVLEDHFCRIACSDEEEGAGNELSG